MRDKAILFCAYSAFTVTRIPADIAEFNESHWSMEIMSNEVNRSTADPAQPSTDTVAPGKPSRRSFLKNTMVAGAATVGAGVLARSTPAFGQEANSSSITAGDIALLRFAAAAELIEADLAAIRGAWGTQLRNAEPLPASSSAT